MQLQRVVFCASRLGKYLGGLDESRDFLGDGTMIPKYPAVNFNFHLSVAHG